MRPDAKTGCRIVAAFVLCTSGAALAQQEDAVRNLFDGIEPIVHLRTYYWDSQSTNDAQSEAWAFGGWAGFNTRWYGDIMQLGVLGYTSQKLYGPSDKGGSQLLGPNQDPINVLGQAYASLRYAGQTFTAYRQMVDQPWVNPYDTRMIPNLFEGYLLSGKVADVDYIGGYVTKVKLRDSNAFAWMSGAAGSTGPQQGMVMGGAQLSIEGGAFVRVAEQYLIDTYNTAYVDAAYPIAMGGDGALRLRGQYANQQSVGSAGLGSFNTSMFGLSGIYDRGPLSLQASWTQTSRNKATQSPFGANPSFLHMMQVDFNDANEKAWLVAGTLDCTKLGATGLTVTAGYGNGHGAIDSSSGASVGSRNETDVTLAYEFDKASALRGLSFGAQGSWLNQAGAAAQGRQLRVFANYELAFNRR